MLSIRTFAIVTSLLAHGAGAWAVMSYSGSDKALDAGASQERVRIEKLIIIENVEIVGNASVNAVAQKAEADDGKKPDEEKPKLAAAAEPASSGLNVARSPETAEHGLAAQRKKVKVKRAVTSKPVRKRAQKKKKNGRTSGANRKVAALAKQRSAGRAKGGGSASARSAYLGMLRRRIASRKIRPSGGSKGRAIVRVVVNSKGRLLSTRLVRSSGSSALDRASMQSVRRASPFPKFPAGLNARSLSVSVPFRYR